MFPIELHLRAVLDTHVVEFKRHTSLPYAPFPHLRFREHGSSEKQPSLFFQKVTWLEEESRFLVVCEDIEVIPACDDCDDDVDALTSNFETALVALTSDWQTRGWQVHGIEPIAKVVSFAPIDQNPTFQAEMAILRHLLAGETTAPAEPGTLRLYGDETA